MCCAVVLAGLQLECHFDAAAVQHWSHLPPWNPVPVCYQNIKSDMKHISVNLVVFSKLILHYWDYLSYDGRLAKALCT